MIYNIAMSVDDSTLREVLASLSAQKDNLPKAGQIEEVYVDNFHEQLNLLDKVGIDVSRFRVPSNQMKPIRVGPSVYTFGEDNPPEYSQERYVARSILLTKIDTVLGYFSLESKDIGFGH